MILLLRLIGVTNAAVWFGGAVFFTFVAGPAFFSERMAEVLQHRYFMGAAAQVVLAKYFLLHHVCATVALAHLVGEWLYTGRQIRRPTLYLLLFISGLGFAGGFWFQPKLRDLHRAKYRLASSVEERDRADASFRAWHSASQIANLVALGGVFVYLTRVASPEVFGGPLGRVKLRS